MKQLLRAKWIAPMDTPVIGDGAIVVAGGRIIAVGDASTLTRNHPVADHRDLGESVILPGLVNAHVHLELNDEPQVTASGPLASWLIEIIQRSPRSDDSGRVAHAIDIGVKQCLRFGVTTIGDISRQSNLTRPLLKDGPLRVISFGEIQAMAQRRDLLEPRLAIAADRSHESERLRVGLSPHAPYSVERRGYERCIALAKEEQFPVSTHLAESADESEFLAEHTGPFRTLWDFLDAWDESVPRFDGGPIRFAKSIGLLDIPSVLAHVNYCDDAELKLLASGKASVVYCPRTHAHFNHPPHRWRDMLAAGVNVAIGTDSVASSPDLNLLDDLRLMRRITPDFPVATLWQLATTRAAAVLGLSASVGSLTPGKLADFIIFDAPQGNDPLEAILREPIFPREVWIGGEQIATLTA
jgi:cytosine/adenosine deaminase-related metal-dependent hydrolase